MAIDKAPPMLDTDARANFSVSNAFFVNITQQNI